MELPAPALVTILGITAAGALVALFAALFRKGRTEHQARAYLAGFTYVLSDDADAAIAELSKAAQLDPQTLETYFALGALFRRKGELDRAIRLHRNILLRPGLSVEVKRRAELALALDYKRSSLKDKATEIFEKLLLEEPDHPEALLHYRRVLEGAGQWELAANVQARLVRLAGKGHGIHAHLLAEASRSSPRDWVKANGLAERAVALNPDCANAQLALGEARQLGELSETAAAPLRESLLLEPELAPRATRLLLRATPDGKDLEQFLREHISSAGPKTAPYELALAVMLKERGQPELAIQQLRSLVDRNPRFWEARKELGALLLAQNRAEDLLVEYRELLATLGQPALAFVCDACRQKLPEHVFRCPSCEEWDVVRRENGSSPPLI
jgi:lipopolysaccharide biosynthesis regulator YciM